MNRVNLNATVPYSLEEPSLISESPNLALQLAKAAFKSGNYQLGEPLPHLASRWENFVVDKEHLSRYNAVCGFDSKNIPVTYPWVICFPLIMNILLSKRFPLGAMGQVHVRNRVSLHEPVDSHSPVLLCASVGSSELTHRGLQWNIDLQVSAQDRILWSGQSTFLYRCKTAVEPQVQDWDQGTPPPSVYSWSVSKDIGRSYASISGDYNPIHLSALTAKLFGFKRAIAHGMWSKARCLAQLDQHIPDAGYTVDVAFRRPVFLPSKVGLSSQQLQDSHRFSLFNLSGGQIHLNGTIF